MGMNNHLVNPMMNYTLMGNYPEYTIPFKKQQIPSIAQPVNHMMNYQMITNYP